MFGLFDWLKIGVGATAGALAVSLPLYLYGKHEGRQQAAVEALELSVSHLRERNEIDGKVTLADAADLCRDIGLPGDQIAECMRRVQQADAQP